MVSIVRRYWWLGILLLVALAVLGISIFDRGLELTSAASGANGIVLGVFGLLISGGGFALTIWQLQKTASAAEASTKAVCQLREKINRYEASIEVSKSISLLQETQRHLKVPSWESLLAVYTNLRISLIRLEEFPSMISGQDRDNINRIAGELNTFADKIERGLIKGSLAIDRSRALRSVRSYEQDMLKLSIALQREVV